MIENEVVFRRSNFKIQAGIKAFNKIAREEYEDDLAVNQNNPLQFICECADEHCKQRISLTSAAYEDIHSSNRRFIVIKGHEVPEIERIIQAAETYYVVEKKMEPPKQTLKSLQDTHTRSAKKNNQ